MDSTTHNIPHNGTWMMLCIAHAGNMYVKLGKIHDYSAEIGIWSIIFTIIQSMPIWYTISLLSIQMPTCTCTSLLLKDIVT